MDLIKKEENQSTDCHPIESKDVFSQENLISCKKYVKSIQQRLDKAVASDDKPKIRWYTHILVKRSKATKILATYKICKENVGSRTAGVDGIAMPSEKNEGRIIMEKLLKSIDVEKKPSPIKRVYIPKPNGDKRPLGIPTLADRINQEIIRQTIEPIVEFHFLPTSHGFRPKRRCQDAVEDIFIKMSRQNQPRWVVEGDIKGCFNHIKHSHIIETLKNWKVSNQICKVIEKMLKANIVWNDEEIATIAGTPQGGVISPMLANVALTALDKEIKNKFVTKYYQIRCEYNPIVRYADDFVIIAESKEKAKEIKSHINIFLKETIGVELSDEKTKVTEISKGFDFLGFNFRKYTRNKKEKLLIKPSKDNVKRVLQKIRDITRKCREMTPEGLIRTLNPIINGWGNYYRHVVAKVTFQNIDKEVWTMVWQWTKAKHQNTPHKSLRKTYFPKTGNRNWVFQGKDGAKLAQAKRIPIKRYVKILNDKRVYDASAKEYWETREYVNAKNAIYGSPWITRMYTRQNGKCDWCGQPFSDKDVQNKEIHQHHMKPKSEGGNDSYGNLRLLHSTCHTSLHSTYSKEQMARYMKNGLDYLRILKPQSR